MASLLISQSVSKFLLHHDNEPNLTLVTFPASSLGEGVDGNLAPNVHVVLPMSQGATSGGHDNEGTSDNQTEDMSLLGHELSGIFHQESQETVVMKRDDTPGVYLFHQTTKNLSQLNILCV